MITVKLIFWSKQVGQEMEFPFPFYSYSYQKKKKKFYHLTPFLNNLLILLFSNVHHNASYHVGSWQHRKEFE